MGKEAKENGGENKVKEEVDEAKRVHLIRIKHTVESTCTDANVWLGLLTIQSRNRTIGASIQQTLLNI